MSLTLTLLGLAAAALMSLLFSALTYSLRDLSRVRLGEDLTRRGKSGYLEPTLDHLGDLIFVTAAVRLFSNIFILLLALHLLDDTGFRPAVRYALAALIAGVVSMICSVAIPHALARHAADSIVGSQVRFLHLLRTLMLPLTKLLRVIDDVVARATGSANGTESQHVEQQILSAVEEGEKEGVVDEEEREMIESVIQFRDTTAGQIMTARPEIIGVPMDATLQQVKAVIEESGHSRIPVYEGTLDQVKGILYARDLLHMLGEPADRLNIRALIRPPYYVPETKPLRDLLNDFRLQKVHIAIVSDEYGGTAGLVTIEDILEELVGDISDEHEPLAPAMFKRLDEQSAEADARLYVDELNRLLGLSVPEDAGYDTLGGFVTTTLGRIPETGTTFEHDGAKFTVLDAEPQKVNRVKIELIPQPVEAGAAASDVQSGAA